ncbi:MAG: class I SAM-dependent methyltransferase [Verrucomicrobiota bacterium]
MNRTNPAAAAPLLPPRPTALAHGILRGCVRHGDLVIDATAGNGHDTVFLAECVGTEGQVLAFDVQPAALAATRARLTTAGLHARVDFFLESHAFMGGRAALGSVAVVMFNLGYLPGDTHELITEPGGTLEGLICAMGLLKPGGMLSAVCYPGHLGGAEEAAAVEHWFAALAAHDWRVARYAAIATRRPAPFLLLGCKPV